MLEEGLVERSEEKDMSGRSSDPGAAGGESALVLLLLLDDEEYEGESSLTPFI